MRRDQQPLLIGKWWTTAHRYSLLQAASEMNYELSAYAMALHHTPFEIMDLVVSARDPGTQAVARTAYSLMTSGIRTITE